MQLAGDSRLPELTQGVAHAVGVEVRETLPTGNHYQG